MLDLDFALSGQRAAVDLMRPSFCMIQGRYIGSRPLKTASCAIEGTVNA